MTEMQTAQMAPMSGVSTAATNRHQAPAVLRSFSAATETAFTACGAVTEASTALTNLMNPTAVSQKASTMHYYLHLGLGVSFLALTVKLSEMCTVVVFSVLSSVLCKMFLMKSVNLSHP